MASEAAAIRDHEVREAPESAEIRDHEAGEAAMVLCPDRIILEFIRAHGPKRVKGHAPRGSSWGVLGDLWSTWGAPERCRERHGRPDRGQERLTGTNLGPTEVEKEGKRIAKRGSREANLGSR